MATEAFVDISLPHIHKLLHFTDVLSLSMFIQLIVWSTSRLSDLQEFTFQTKILAYLWILKI